MSYPKPIKFTNNELEHIYRVIEQYGLNFYDEAGNTGHVNRDRTGELKTTKSILKKICSRTGRDPNLDIMI